MKNLILLPVVLIAVFTGCTHNKIKKEPQDDAQSWVGLQQEAVGHLRENSFGEAIENIYEMIDLAGSDPQRWEYIRMALVSIPPDLSLPLIEQAVQNKYIKNNAGELYGFSRVLTQLQENHKALELINKAVNKDKKETYVYWRARLYLMTENVDSAENDYKWLLKKDANNVEYVGQYATLLSFTQRNEAAIQLLSGHEQSPKLLFQQLILLFQQDKEHKVKDKFADLKTLIENQELDSAQYLDIAELAYWLEDYDTSLELLQKVKSSEDLGEAKLMMGRVLIKKDDDDRAVVLFRQVQNGPEEQAIPAYLHEIALHRERQDFVDGIEVATQALTMFSNNADLLYERAMLFEQVDDIDALEQDLMQIIQDDSDNANALNALGYTWADRNMKLDQAYEYIIRAYELEPENKAILDSVGWIYFRRGELEQAEKYLLLAIEDNEFDRESYDHLVEVLNAQGKTQQADQIIIKIKELFQSQ